MPKINNKSPNFPEAEKKNLSLPVHERLYKVNSKSKVREENNNRKNTEYSRENLLTEKSQNSKQFLTTESGSNTFRP